MNYLDRNKNLRKKKNRCINSTIFQLVILQIFHRIIQEFPQPLISIENIDKTRLVVNRDKPRGLGTSFINRVLLDRLDLSLKLLKRVFDNVLQWTTPTPSPCCPPRITWATFLTLRGMIWDFSYSPEAKIPFPFFGFDSWGFGAWILDLGLGLMLVNQIHKSFTLH